MNGPHRLEIDDRIREALGRVHDPCSVGQRAPMSILDMGLVRSWELDESGALTIHFCVTAPSCTMAPHFVQAAEREVEAVPGISKVSMELDPTFQWSPERMTAGGKAIRRRQLERLKMPVRPQQWKNKAALSEVSAGG